MKRLVALLLTIALLTGICACAMADATYVSIKSQVNTALGSPFSTKTDFTNPSGLLCIGFNLPDNQVLLLGYNANGTYEGCSWSANLNNSVRLMYDICCNFNNYPNLMIGYIFTDGDDYSFISTASDAASMASIIADVFGY